MADDDLHTRLVLLERSVVTKDQLVEREDKLLGRMEDMLKRYISQASDDQRHQFKIFGHEMADQLREWRDRIHEERDELAAKREAERAQKAPVVQMSPIRAWIMANWMWAAGVGLLIVALRPDLAAAAFRALT